MKLLIIGMLIILNSVFASSALEKKSVRKVASKEDIECFLKKMTSKGKVKVIDSCTIRPESVSGNYTCVLTEVKSTSVNVFQLELNSEKNQISGNVYNDSGKRIAVLEISRREGIDFFEEGKSYDDWNDVRIGCGSK